MSDENEDQSVETFKKCNPILRTINGSVPDLSDIPDADADSVEGDPVDTTSIDNCFIDNASVDTVSTDNCIQDSLSINNSSINISIDLHDASESTLDIQEITQSILDLEGTQISPNSSGLGYGATEFQRLNQVPSSPPPSYEHVLAETRLAQQVSLEQSQASSSESVSSKVNSTVTSPTEPRKGIEIMHKSHKEFYRAVAKQWGITCKMSDHCRCLDCQSMYFDCEYDQNEQEKTDGGLGAGTPMFISEVMHGSACVLL
ncbi:UNVERIFIED_CONTAM: hypothetical protein PYX00_010342 [Menopon gallinae]|uniref:DUF4802 domain-containing protein n=1 Tax=Menopon gallinae TaxID=328185 RepID=A0AAW2HEY4_9NEOP